MHVVYVVAAAAEVLLKELPRDNLSCFIGG